MLESKSQYSLKNLDLICKRLPKIGECRVSPKTLFFYGDQNSVTPQVIPVFYCEGRLYKFEKGSLLFKNITTIGLVRRHINPAEILYFHSGAKGEKYECTFKEDQDKFLYTKGPIRQLFGQKADLVTREELEAIVARL